MTEDLPAVVQPEPTREVATADTDSWIGVVGEVAKFAGYIADTEFVPKSLRGAPAATTAAIMYGREVGLPPMTALTQTHVIEGKPSMSAEAMRALILAAGHDIEVVESTGGKCVMRGRRRGSERWSAPVEWTIDAARAAGLLNKSNWKSYPRQMLQARCTAELARLVFPDVIHGFRATEELEDTGAVEGEAFTAPAGSTPVKRAAKKTTRKALPAPAPVEDPKDRPAAAPGPPLPGEDGYDDVAPALRGDGGAPELPVGGEGSSEGEASEHEPPAGETGSEGSVGGSSDPEATEERRGPRKATRAQLRMIEGSLTTLGVDNDRDERHLIAGALAGRAVTSFNDLTSGDASKIIDTLARVKDKDALNELLDAMEDAKGDAAIMAGAR